jgi:hypothetical protein
MKTKLILLILAAFSLISCGTGTMLFFGPKGIEVIPPQENVVIPSKAIIKPSK